MVRSDKNQANNGKKPSTSSDYDQEYVTSESDTVSDGRESVHKQNLYIVSFPIIFLFNILRSILYQFFIIFKYIFNVSSQFLYHPLRKREKTIEICVNDTNDPTINQNVDTIENMSAPQTAAGPGPGDPMLAKQKHHHRRAFEYISKALKIDEENEGKYQLVLSQQFKLHKSIK